MELCGEKQFHFSEDLSLIWLEWKTSHKILRERESFVVSGSETVFMPGDPRPTDPWSFRVPSPGHSIWLSGCACEKSRPPNNLPGGLPWNWAGRLVGNQTSFKSCLAESCLVSRGALLKWNSLRQTFQVRWIGKFQQKPVSAEIFQPALFVGLF